MIFAKRYHVIILILFLISCSGPKETEDKKTVFRYNEAGGITSLDPAYSRNLANIWACNMLYNGLVEADDSLRIRPAIARSWDISDDGKTYTFHLRQDVFFHDHPMFPEGQGRKVRAGDFVRSFSRIIDPQTASPGAWVFAQVKMPADSAFRAPDDSTFVIRLNEAFPPFLGILSMKYCSVIPWDIVEKAGKDFRSQPCGTGPFRFQYWKEGVKLVFRKNDLYFEYDTTGERLPYLDAVSVTFLMDKQAAFLEFVKGNLDFLSGLDPSYKDEILTPGGQLNPKYNKHCYLLKTPYLNNEYLGFLLDTTHDAGKSAFIKNVKFRKAINYGFDRKRMIRYLRNNIGTPGIYGIVPPGLPSFDTGAMKGYDYRPDSVRKLLREAGMEGKNPEITLSTTSDYLDLCRFIQHQLGEFGIITEISVNPPATNAQLVANSKVQFFRASWIADYPDAENYLSLFYSRNFSPSGPNYTHFTDPLFDRLYETARNTVDPELRYELYQTMNRIMMEKAPVVVLYYDEVLRFIHNDFIGIGANPINLLDLRRARKITD
ncbi:MAG: ABC transporter substrate-binding protein [Bacteroidetes bacterium]|nr:ABC transporter substrate-binding protein [Bacteroidota bacterium]